jgi:hypothetical protein
MRLGRLGLAPQADVTADELRDARIAAARKHPAWTEIQNDLVPRGRGWLVSAGTDEIFAAHRGVVFDTGKVSILADHVPLVFYVDDAGDLVFLERVSNPATWLQYVERRERKRLRAVR